MSAWIRPRDGQVQHSPWLRAKPVNPSNALSRKSSCAAATSSKKMLGLLPPSSSVTGIRFWLAYCMISRPVVVSPGNAILAMRLAGFPPEAVDDVDHARREDVGDQLHDLEDRPRCLLGGLDDHAVARGQG